MPSMALNNLNKASKIVIAGSGCWGLSTALHLTRAGYTNISLFDRANSIPSTHSAAYDLNKIVRAEYEDPFYTDLALDAIKGWKTPLFGPYYHQTGYVVATTGRAPSKARKHLEDALANIEHHPVFGPGVKRLNGPEDFKDYTWQYSGPLTGFTGYFNRLAGYAHSSNTLRAVWEHLSRQGVKSILGEKKGRIERLTYSGSRCVGVETADGQSHSADLVIVALGAHGASLVPNLGKFVVARSWSVAHVQLTKEECDFLRGIPTTNVRDLGFFFEPDPETRLFKLCPLGAGYTNTSAEDGVSLPPAGELPPPQDYIPKADEMKLRQLLRETFPWMADRPFVEQRLCWFADTRDSDYCIDFVPKTDNSILCLSGDSGHGFKMMPVFGQWVVDLVHAGRQDEARWQWRNVKGGAQSWGKDVSWRIGEGAEVRDLIANREKEIRARL